MSLSASKCSKGCESGWTGYLDESSSHSLEEWHAGGSVECEKGGRKVEGDEEEEEENLSMVSDASSGPPSHEVEDDCSNESCSMGKRWSRCKSKSKKKAAKESGKGEQQQHFSYYYEETASAPRLKCTEQEKTGPQDLHHNRNSAAPAEKANSGKKGGLKSRK